MLEERGLPKRLIRVVVQGNRLCGSNKWKVCYSTMGKRRSKARMSIEFILFSLYISDKKEYMSGRQTERVMVGKMKCLVLAYADGLVLLAKTEEDMMRKFWRRKAEKDQTRRD